MNNRRIKPIKHISLPVSNYIAVFLLFTILVILATSDWILDTLNDIQQTAEHAARDIANIEVKNAISKVINASKMDAMTFAHWQETLQQFDDPTYFIYWRNNRATQSIILPAYVIDATLYNDSGNHLITDPNDKMPEPLPIQDMLFISDQATPMLYYFHPVTKTDTNKTLGYVGIKIDFLYALHMLNDFNSVKNNSIKIRPSNAALTNMKDILSATSYEYLDLGFSNELHNLSKKAIITIIIIAISLAFIGYLMVIFLFQKPLNKLSNNIRNFHLDNHDDQQLYLHNKLPLRELESLRIAFNNYQQELDKMHNHLDQKNKELWQLAHKDTLTSVSNRLAYESDWKQLLHLIHGQRLPVSVMLIDCDNFKAINDSYGHDTGDKVIQAVANSLQKAMRINDRLYRIGGDEFAAHLLNASTEQAIQLAERCQSNLAEVDFKSLGIKEPVRFSIGISSTCADNETELHNLLKQADIAMYQAKGPSQKKIICYDENSHSMTEALVSNRYVNAVYNAIDQLHGIRLHYQPILSINSEQNGFYEVLTRLKDDEGLIIPSNIFPVVTTQGLEEKFDHSIIQTLDRVLSNNELPSNTSLSINLDGMTVLSSNLIHILQPLNKHLAHHKIILEITETALITDLTGVSETLKQIREMGFIVALDDFGSGYSSLRYLSRMPVDIVKFDIDMTRELVGNHKQQKVVTDIAKMILNSGYQLVAEGIDSEQLLDITRELGFTYAQGFLFARPSDRISASQKLTIDTFRRD